MRELFIFQIWDYYHQHFWPLVLSLSLLVVSVFSSMIGYNYLPIILIVISTFIYLKSYLKIPQVFGIFRGLVFYLVIILVSIYCFNNVYIEKGIINDSKTTHEFLDTLYFSIVTWTTLGYGDFQPTQEARMWAASEAMMGYVYMGLLVGLIINGLTPENGRFKDKKPANRYSR